MNKSLFLINLVLMLVWVLATGALTEENLLFGFLLGFGILWLIYVKRTEITYFSLIPRLLSFLSFVIWEIIKANFQTLVQSLYSKEKLKPAFIGIPLEIDGDAEILALSQMINLTPGTLVIDVSDDKKMLYVHVVHCEDKKKFLEGIRYYEERLMKITR